MQSTFSDFQGSLLSLTNDSVDDLAVSRLDQGLLCVLAGVELLDGVAQMPRIGRVGEEVGSPQLRFSRIERP